MKYFIIKIVPSLNCTDVLELLVEIGLLVLEKQNDEENVCSILYIINLFKKYKQYGKKFFNKTVACFDFTSGC